MSNEYKDWLLDRVADVLFEARVIDRIEEYWYPGRDIIEVEGLKDNQKVRFAVWFDDNECEWKFEHRELAK